MAALAAVVVAALLVAACGAASPGTATGTDPTTDVGPGVGAARHASGEAPRPERSTELAAALAATTLPPLPASAEPEALEPWEVLVAVAKPEVSRLAAYDAPDGEGERVRFDIPLRNPWFFDGDLVLLVEQGRETDEWVQVLLPVRPNGTTAWIRTADVEFRRHRMHAEVGLSDHRLRVWDADELLVETEVVLGTDATPTPPGRYYVNAHVEPANPRGAYGPHILALSGYSEALETFGGGIPTLAIHGTNRPELLGQNRSNGCIRIPNQVIEQLAELVPLGMPVEVVA